MSPSYAVRTYADRKPALVRLGEDGFQIFDRADLGRLLVAPEVDGVPEPARAQAHAAAARFLSDGKRGTCRLGDGSTAARPFVEVVYRCEKIRPAAASQAGPSRGAPSPAGTASVARTPALPRAESTPRVEAAPPVLAPRATSPAEAFTLRMNRL